MTPRADQKPPILKAHWGIQGVDHVNAIRFSPDGQRLAIASACGRVFVVSASSGTVDRIVGNHRFGALVIEWSPDGSRLATAGQDGFLRLYDGRSLELLSEHQLGAWVEHGTWSESGEFFYAAAGKSLRAFTADGFLHREFAPHKNTIAGLSAEPRGKRLATASYLGVWLWEPDEHEPIDYHEWPGAFTSVRWGPTGRYIAGGCLDSAIRFSDLDEGQMFQMTGYREKVTHLDWHHTGMWLASGDGELAMLWDFSGEGPQGTEPIRLEGDLASVSAVAFSPGLRPLLATGGRSGLVLVQEFLDEGIVGAQANQGEVSCLSWSPDGGTLAVGYDTGIVTSLSIPGGKSHANL